ncbi:MAG: alpha/beta hydrolase [Anaerolineae bacterium]
MTDASTLDVQGIPLAYSVSQPRGVAIGTPMLALHGWGASRSSMLPATDRLAALGHQALILDLPGFGDTPAPPKAWSVSDYANFVLAALDALDLDRVNLFGHSFGGRISLILGADHDDRVGKLILADSAGIPPKRSWSSQARLKTYRTARQTLEAVGARGLSQQLRGWYNARYGSSDFQQTSGVMRETFIRVISQDLRPFAARVKRPTLLFWGDRDDDTPLWQGQELEKLMPDAGLVVLAGAGHYSYLDKLDEFVRVADFFLRQNESAPA